jgi:hypothetical protein
MLIKPRIDKSQRRDVRVGRNSERRFRDLRSPASSGGRSVKGDPILGCSASCLIGARLGLVEEALGGREPRRFGQIEDMLDEVAAGRLMLMNLGHQRSGFLAWSLARGKPAPNQAGP